MKIKKQANSYFIVFIFLLFFLFHTRLYGEDIEKKIMKCLPVSKPVEIDGNLKEWDLSMFEEIVLDPEEEQFRAKVWTMYDDKFFYVAFDVIDSSPMKNSGDDPFLAFKTGDDVEVFFSSNPKADSKRAEPTENDYRVLMTYLRNEKPIVYGYRYIVPGTEPRFIVSPGGKTRCDKGEYVANAQMKAKTNNNDYIVESKIPFSFFGNFIPKKGLKTFFNLAISFSDDGGQRNAVKVYWNGENFMCTDVSIEMKMEPVRWGFIEFQ